MINLSSASLNTPESDVSKSITQLSEQRQQTIAQFDYNLPVTDREYESIGRVIQQNPDEEPYRFASAIRFSRELGLTVENAMMRLDDLTEYQTGKKFSPTKSTWKAIVDSFEIGKLQIPKADLEKQYKYLDLAGEDTSQIEQQIAEYERMFTELGDSTPRNLLTQALKAGAQTLPYTAKIALGGASKGMVAGLGAAGAAALFGVAAVGALPVSIAASIIAVATAAGTAFSFKEAYDLMEGGEYYRMRKNGIPKDIALPMSNMSAWVQAGVESFLGLVPAGVGKITGAQTLTSRALAKLAISGKWGTAGKFLGTWVGQSFEEGAEEAVQALTGWTADIIAAELSDVMPPERSIPILTEALEGAKQGFLASLVLGAGGSVMSSVSDTSLLGQIRRDAQATPSKESFIDKHRANAPEGVAESEWTSALSEVYEQNKPKRTEQQAEQELDVTPGEATPVSRLKNGRIYAQESEQVSVAPDGSESRILKVGDPISSKRYGYIGYTRTDNAIEIDEVRFGSTYENVRKESILELGRQNPGVDIVWNPQTEALQAIRDEIIAEQGSLNPYTTNQTNVEPRLALQEKIKQAMPTLDAPQRTAAATLIELRAEAKGMTLESYMDTYFDQRVFAEEGLQGTERGGITFEQTEDGVKALLYAGKNADFSTFSHEAFHLFRREMAQTPQLQSALTQASQDEAFYKFVQDNKSFLKMDTAKASSILANFSDNWTRDQEELVAGLWELYLKEGKAPTSRLEALFDKIKNWFGRIYGRLSQTTQLDPRIREVFDSLIDKDSELAQQVRGQKSEVVQGEAAQEQLFQEDPPTDSPAFKKWFGESKVVDENGEPLVMYHGTIQSFTTFRYGDIGFHFGTRAQAETRVEDESSPNMMEVYLSIQKPYEAGSDYGSWDGDYLAEMFIEREEFTDEKDVESLRKISKLQTPKANIELRRFLQDKGFDGVVYPNQFEDSEENDSYIAFSPTQIKSVNNQGTWDAGNPNILFQEAVEKINNGSLAVLHNISADKLVSADEIGGLPSPSLAITRPEIPFEQFGEITLIADPSVATKAMEEGRLYDRDVWSPTVPRAEWKINQKVIDKFDKKIMPVIYKETGKYFSGSDAFSSLDIASGPSSLTSSYKRNLGAQIAFLKDSGIDYELKFKKPNPPFSFPLEVIEDNLEYFRSTRLETENVDGVREYLRPKIDEHLEKSLALKKERNTALYENMKKDSMERSLRFGVLDKVFNFAKTYDKDALVFDEYRTEDSIHQTIKDHDSDFTSWIKDNINEAYTDPKIKIGTKKYEYNAENILEWMRSQSERASQDTMTYGPGKAASNAGSPFANREQVRDFEGTLITREAQGVIWEETIKPLTESIQNELPNYNNKYGTWESLDAIYEAIGNYITKYGSTGTVPLMRKELSAKSFTKVPTWLLEQSVLLARRLATIQQDYFEAKPNRVVSLDEFSTAVVPNTLSNRNREILESHNIAILEYENTKDRTDIVAKQYSEKPSTLFQDENTILTEASQFSSWEDFRDGYTAFLEAMYDEVPDYDDDWFRNTWERANPTGNDQASDQRFLQDMNSEGLLPFLKEIGRIIQERLEQPGDQEEADYTDRLQNIKARIQQEVSPFMRNTALQSLKTTPSKQSLKAVRTTIENATRFYRDVYAEVMNKPDMKPMVIDEFLPSIDEPLFSEVETASITERVNLSKRIEAAELKKKILSGKETFNGEAEKVIRQMDSEIKAEQEKIAKLEADLLKTGTRLSDTERKAVDLSAQIEETRRELDKAQKNIQKRIAKNQTVPQSMMTERANLSEKVKNLMSEFNLLSKTNRTKASLDKQQAVKKAKDSIRANQKEKADAVRVRKYKERLAAKIMAPVSKATDYKYKLPILAIQATIDPKFRTGNVKYNGKTVALKDIQAIVDQLGEYDITQTLPKRIADRLDKTPLNELTLVDLEEIASRVATLRKTGRLVQQARSIFQSELANSYAQTISNSLIDTGKYIPPPATGSVEDIQAKRSIRERFRSVFYDTIDMPRKAIMLDNDTKGIAYDMLVDRQRDAYRNKELNIERRMKGIEQVMKDTGITYEDAYKQVDVDGTTFTISDLAMVYMGAKNEQSRMAIAYGNLMDARERDGMTNEEVRSVGDERLAKVLEAAEANLTPDMLKVLDAISNDFNNEFDRMNEVAIREFNTPISRVDNYVPIRRQEMTGDDLANAVADDWMNMNAGGAKVGIEKGMTITRVNIAPKNQKPMKLDLFGTHAEAMNMQEHFIAFAEYGRELNRVFKGNQALRETIRGTYGDSMLSDIDDYINEVINPKAFQRMKNVDKAIRALRGNLYAAYLTYKTSGIVLQFITSPMPFLAEVNPLKLASAYMEVTAKPKETMAMINELSVVMRKRVMDPAWKLVKDESAKYSRPLQKKFKRFQEIGGMGMEIADKWSVSGGWLAVFKNEIGKADIVDDKAIQQAVKKADDVVLRTQPSSRPEDLAPLFKQGGEALKAFTQFQTALNVIWKNVVFDVPLFIRQGEYGKAIGQSVGYIMAGALLNAVMEGFDDDDDEAQKAKKLLYWSFTQFTDSVPLIGTLVNNVAESVITGEKPYMFPTAFYPSASEIAKGVINLSQGEWEKAVKDLSEGFGYATGLPVSGAKQIIRAFDEGPQAVLGRIE